ncbi:MAG TPA: N,N-dimethylformamidase beta subunit family domain-containing protein [Vicinamibacteria bacterium]|nr:N,N-dimethylformamidase beta subunit family domain-containing protein [Vicinamibacteria bacterium]
MSARPPGYYENALWAYSDATSYAPGETATFFVSSPVPEVACTVSRVGAAETTVHAVRRIRAGHHGVPEDAYRAGCGWPETFALRVGADWPSGYYRVQLRAEGEPELRAEHFFVVRPAHPGARARHVLVLATNTYQAYNGWGGRNLYGSDAAFADSPDQLRHRPTPTPVVAWDRPFSRCLLQPPGPTRIPTSRRRGMGEPLGVPDATAELVAAGASVWDMPAGFVHKWEQQFVAFAERAGIALDYLAQSDLDARPDVLAAYPSYLSVGHDEYWSWEERDAVEAFVDAGGSASFFSGNTCYWQVRFERGGRSLVGYKFTAPREDPVLGSDRQGRLTSLWSDPLVGRPETQLTGVTFARAGYARAGYALSRGTAGYTIYRPDHWCLAGTDLFYGDVLGDEFALCAYETDGCAFRFEEGLPVPTGEGGTPPDFEIVGLAPATLGEPEPTPGEGLLGRDDALFVASRLFSGDVERALRGHAAFGSFRRGRGEVFTAGTTEWAWGLAAGDRFVERITRNVLARAERRARPSR